MKVGEREELTALMPLEEEKDKAQYGLLDKSIQQPAPA